MFNHAMTFAAAVLSIGAAGSIGYGRDVTPADRPVLHLSVAPPAADPPRSPALVVPARVADEPVFTWVMPAARDTGGAYTPAASTIQHFTPAEPDALDALGNVFDVQDNERPWSTTTSIRLQAKTDAGIGRWTPFMSVAREVGAVEDRERLGIGGGLAYYFAPNANFGTELLYFGDRGNSNNAWERETRVTARFQFEF